MNVDDMVAQTKADLKRVTDQLAAKTKEAEELAAKRDKLLADLDDCTSFQTYQADKVAPPVQVKP